jgi:hypothetical protein
MPTQSPYRIEPTDDERAILDERARAHTAPYWEVVRARIVLLAAEGFPNKEIAKRLYTTPQTVSKWRKRFHQEGLGGLEDRPRSGRPPTFSPFGRGRGEGFGLRASGDQRGSVEPLEHGGGGPGGR